MTKKRNKRGRMMTEWMKRGNISIEPIKEDKRYKTAKHGKKIK